MTAVTTPLTSACSASSKFHELESWLASPLALASPLHRIEQQQDHQGREVQRLLLQSHVNQRGVGDVGPALLVQSNDSPLLFSHRRLQRSGIEHIALNDPEFRVLERKFCRVAYQGRHLVSLVERLFDQLPPGPTGGANDQEAERPARA